MSLVDSRLILSIVDGNLQEAANLCALFFDSARKHTAQMVSASRSGDRVAMGRAVHQMAGAAGTCGFSELEKSLRGMDLSVERGELLPDRAEIERLENLLNQAEAEARAAFAGAVWYP